MSEQTIIFFLLICIALLIGVILYQQFAFRSGIQTKLRKISGKLKEITDTDSDERVMVFTLESTPYEKTTFTVRFKRMSY